MNVADALEAAVAKAPGQAAIVFEERTISYRELDEMSTDMICEMVELND